jgi:hypothetical protein
MRFSDLTLFCSHLMAQGDMKNLRGQMYKLTGSELLTPNDVADRLSRVLNEKIHFEELNRQQIEGYLDVLGFNGPMMEAALGIFELINNGKMAFKSDDQKKTIGQDPISMEHWLKDNAVHFKQLKKA